MPFYEIHHSYSLTHEQREVIARSVTNLHCATFTTPSFFVHVQFTAHDINDRTYFLAGKPRTVNSNHIVGTVRMSPARTKSDFDTLAAKIEDAWYDAIKDPGQVGQDIEEEKRLLKMTFVPMITIREGGMAIPEAGHEGGWLKEKLPYIKEMSEKGLEDFSDMLKELEQREDLKKLLE